MPTPTLPRDLRLRNEGTLLAVLAGILVLLNVISVRNFFRLDLTRSHAYSLARVSREYMRGLKDPLTVKAFFTKNLPAPYNSNARYLRDLLADYRAYSRGRLNFQFIDPADDPAYQQEARSLGVYEIQLTAVQKDQFEQKNGFMGVVLIYQDRHEVIPLVQETSGLEYQLTSAIKKLLQSETKVLGVTQGYGEPGLNEGLDNLRQVLAKSYEVVPVDMTTGAIPDRLNALLVAGPTQKMPDDRLYALDHFLRSGKNLALMAPMVKADPRVTMQANPVASGLGRLLAAWGVDVSTNLVYDAQCQRIAVSQRGPGFIMQNIVPYPPFPLITNLDAGNPINQNLQGYTLPFVSSLSLDPAVLKANGLTAAVLAKSSVQAWEQRNFFMLSPQFIQPPQREQLRQFDLVATVTGKFPSAFTPDHLPVPNRKGETLPPWVTEARPARIVVIGGADFLTNDFVNPRGGDQTLHFTENLVDWVAQDPALIEIRNKGVTPPTLGNVPDAQRRLIKYFNLVGLPLLAALAGLVMWRRFQVRRLAIAAQFKV